MHKIALLLSVAAVTVAVLCVVPSAAAMKHVKEEDRGLADENHVPNAAAGGMGSEPAAVTKAPKPQHNAKLLNRLGMKRVRTSGGVDGENAAGNNHHRKRLAGQSRSKYGAAGADGGAGKGGTDSQMFIVKLPPHAHFYGDGSAAHQKHQQHPLNNVQQPPYKSLNTVPVGFVSNGKPARVYHWNLPVIKHALGGRYRSGGGGGGGNNDVAKHQLQYGDFELPSSAGTKVMPRRTLYYKPRAAGKPVKKSFVNNGKPNGFYVVSANKNSAAAVQPQYHKIVKTYYGSGDD